MKRIGKAVLILEGHPSDDDINHAIEYAKAHHMHVEQRITLFDPMQVDWRGKPSERWLLPKVGDHIDIIPKTQLNDVFDPHSPSVPQDIQTRFVCTAGSTIRYYSSTDWAGYLLVNRDGIICWTELERLV